MTNLNKKILLSGLVAIFAFVTMIGATYAWFQITSVVNVEPINISISSSESLLITMDEGYSLPADNAYLTNPTNYVTNLTNADIIAAGYDFTGGRIEMAPITTIDGIAFTSRSGGAVSSTPSLVTPGDFIEVSVWLFSQSSSVTVAVYNYAASAANTLSLADDVINCLRMSTQVSGSGTSLIYGLDKDLDFAFLPNIVGYDAGTPANNTINSTVKTNLIALNGEYYSGTDTPVVGQVTNVLADAETVVTLTVGVPQKVTLRIWLEGWDLDCDLNLIGAEFALAFGFSIKAVV